MNAPHTPRVDLFTGIHKALRAGLFDLTARAGATDWSDPAEVAELGTRWDAMAELLHSHTEHEDKYIFRLLDGHEAALTLPEDDHRDLDDLLHDLEERFAVLRAGGDPDAGLAWYRDLARYVGTTLHHLHEEETTVMAAIWRVRSDEELSACREQFLAATPAPVTRTSIRWLLPAIERPARLGWLAGLAGAPAPVREMVADTARQVLAPADAAQARAALGLA
ncbi:hemerythrin domain-containing protein [Dactylosporangium aurantiacum]|uniref:Hemerythrin domain-containing protein n=1 Tax=Dactylosporangium aurantiacum TaxID=35754 RepID=A0A9Q9IQ06_9ACTN|nr:hemerythrin domain-containing protein [Dactylosporangium aurantiacum]MDG6108634.1 hemerythrin domain-containing protein [Dactylosporangium aurantiacum]UWZ59148.1 hemerythrin domain-containing protein [Dactylosporangium aurantiacum]